MNILTTCQDIDILEIMIIVRKLMSLIQIIGPILVVILGGLDVLKAVSSSNQDAITKSIKKIPNRLITCAIIFFIPIIITFACDLVDGSNDVVSCFNNANPTYLQNTYKELALQYVENAEKEPTAYNVAIAEKLIKKLDDKSLAKEYSARIEKIRPTISNDVVINFAKPTAPTINPNSPVGDQVVAYAKGQLGTPYVWGGKNLETGVDCSGFIQEVYKYFGVNLTGNANTQATSGIGKIIYGIENAKPGDLIFYDNRGGSCDGVYDHVAIYMGNGQRIHASGNQDCPNSAASMYCKVLVTNNVFSHPNINCNGTTNEESRSRIIRIFE